MQSTMSKTALFWILSSENKDSCKDFTFTYRFIDILDEMLPRFRRVRANKNAICISSVAHSTSVTLPFTRCHSF